MSFGCERSCSSPRRVSNFNSKVGLPQGGIYPDINFERDPLNIFRVRVLTSSGSTGGGGGRGGRGGGDAKTIISPNTSFCDIMRQLREHYFPIHTGRRLCYLQQLYHNFLLQCPSCPGVHLAPVDSILHLG